MRRTKKIWLIVATVLAAGGLLTFASAMIALRFDFASLEGGRYETNVYRSIEEIRQISIDTDTADVVLLPSADEECSVVCYEEKRAKHSVTVVDGTLSVKVNNMRKWYDHIGIFLEQPSVTVYLPNTAYAQLSVDTDTGNVRIPKELSFDGVYVSGDTGDILCEASASENTEIKTATGNINVRDVCTGKLHLLASTGNVEVRGASVEGAAEIKTSTGKIELSNVNCKRLSAGSKTGEIVLLRVMGLDDFEIESSTGNVTLTHSDASRIFIRTSTGNVDGSLLSEKLFFAETSTGRIDVPKTVTGGRCEIKTSTGNISVRIDPKNENSD